MGTLGSGWHTEAGRLARECSDQKPPDSRRWRKEVRIPGSTRRAAVGATGSGESPGLGHDGSGAWGGR